MYRNERRTERISLFCIIMSFKCNHLWFISDKQLATLFSYSLMCLNVLQHCKRKQMEFLKLILRLHAVHEYKYKLTLINDIFIFRNMISKNITLTIQVNNFKAIEYDTDDCNHLMNQLLYLHSQVNQNGDHQFKKPFPDISGQRETSRHSLFLVTTCFIHNVMCIFQGAST